MRARLFVLTLFAIITAGAARAEDDPAPDCENPQTQAELNICAADSAEQADKALNAQYKLARQHALNWDKGLSEGGVSAEAALKTAQRAWIAYRDAECDLEAVTIDGGSMQSMIISGCLETLSKARTQELKQISEALGN